MHTEQNEEFGLLHRSVDGTANLYYVPMATAPEHLKQQIATNNRNSRFKYQITIPDDGYDWDGCGIDMDGLVDEGDGWPRMPCDFNARCFEVMEFLESVAVESNLFTPAFLPPISFMVTLSADTD